MKVNYSRLLITCTLVTNVLACQTTSNKKQNPESGPTETPPAIPVVVSRIQNAQEGGQLVLSGSTEAETTVNLGFMVGGKLNRVVIQEGQTIRAGQLIASIEPTDYQLGVTIANANVARVQDEYNRLTILKERGSLTPSDYEKAVTGLEEVKARQQLAAKNLRETKLYSPISGIVARKGANAGEIIPQGQPLFQIADIQPIKVRVSVPESEVGQLRLGQSAQITIPAMNKSYTGQISLIGAVADPASRAYSVKIDLPNPTLQIRPGMIADARLVATNTKKALVLPGNVVLRDDDGSTYVFVADVQKKQAFKRKVTVGQVFASDIEITSGLNATDLIVTGGQQKLQDGVSIQFNQPAK
ncbi:efflux RND transporter periplasmic adaptor subunit [Spirosoma pollinicola]|uniref:Efflux RND transporter periplasmic adaptor subunit n=1 Tax=Spirosoma pollinicola TaxID=2057025 RepID=A0A2K8YYQ6_9BACT|nr:efflux RND transporter periplasmic adaptor subunit [Spirosoma pollinicola]AUD02755.1 efflux RND transporter periplasmic adaptor subunit [Spirosoma pollinicola]